MENEIGNLAQPLGFEREEPPTSPEEMEARTQRNVGLLQRPETRAALMQFAIQVLQPNAPGQSTIGKIAGAVGSGAEASTRVTDKAEQTRQQGIQEGLAERKVTDSELGTQIDVKAEGRLQEQGDRTLALQKDTFELATRKLEETLKTKLSDQDLTLWQSIFDAAGDSAKIGNPIDIEAMTDQFLKARKTLREEVKSLPDDQVSAAIDGGHGDALLRQEKAGKLKLTTAQKAMIASRKEASLETDEVSSPIVDEAEATSNLVNIQLRKLVGGPLNTSLSRIRTKNKLPKDPSTISKVTWRSIKANPEALKIAQRKYGATLVNQLIGG